VLDVTRAIHADAKGFAAVLAEALLQYVECRIIELAKERGRASFVCSFGCTAQYYQTFTSPTSQLLR